jgi:hypothetical protein
MRAARAFVGLEDNDWLVCLGCKMGKALPVPNVFQVEADNVCCGIFNEILKEISLIEHELVPGTDKLVNAEIVARKKEENVVQESTALRDERQSALFHKTLVKRNERGYQAIL